MSREMPSTPKWWPEAMKTTLGGLAPQIEKAKTDEVRKGILVKLGKTYEDELNRPDDAMDTFKKVLKIDPLNEEALNSLEIIFNTKEMYKELIEVLKKKIERLDSETAKEDLVRLYLNMGEIYELHMQESIAAVKCFQKVIEIDETNMTALKGLERLFINMEKLQDLLDVLEMQFNVTMHWRILKEYTRV